MPVEGQYHFNAPHIEVVNKDPKELFQQCYKPYMDEKPSRDKPSKVIPQQETSTKARLTKKGPLKLAGAIPDVLKSTGITALVFTVNNRIGSEDFHKSMSELKGKLVSPPLQIKQNRLWLLQEA